MIKAITAFFGAVKSFMGWLTNRQLIDAGKAIERGKIHAKNAKNQARYADIAVNKPSKSDTVDSLRNGDF